MKILKINKIGKIHNLKIFTQGLDINWKYTTYPTPRSTHHYERSLVGLFSIPINRFIFNIKLRFNKTKEQCEGCGEGWVEYEIDDPNCTGGIWRVCKNCVNFYDWGCTRRKIKNEM